MNIGAGGNSQSWMSQATPVNLRSAFPPVRFPVKAADDAFHVAIATVNGMDYLLT